jgi:uncharacterized protein (TIGR02594 family)
MSLTPEWLRVAKEEARIGVREIPGPAHEQRILTYHEATTLHATTDEIAWCSSFVCWCLEQAHFHSTRSAAARSYLTWGREIKPAPYGAIVVLKRGDNPAQAHVGFLVGSYRSDEVMVIAGNQNDAVNVRSFPMAAVLGMRWPG